MQVQLCALNASLAHENHMLCPATCLVLGRWKMTLSSMPLKSWDRSLSASSRTSSLQFSMLATYTNTGDAIG